MRGRKGPTKMAQHKPTKEKNDRLWVRKQLPQDSGSLRKAVYCHKLNLSIFLLLGSKYTERASSQSLLGETYILRANTSLVLVRNTVHYSAHSVRKVKHFP